MMGGYGGYGMMRGGYGGYGPSFGSELAMSY